MVEKWWSTKKKEKRKKKKKNDVQVAVRDQLDLGPVHLGR